MYRQFFMVLTIVAVIHGGQSQLNPFLIYAIRFKEYASKILPDSISHDLMGNPFNTISKMVDDANIKSCTKHLLQYVQNPQSPSVPKCVNPEDLNALNAALEAAWQMPSHVGPECKDIFSGDTDVLKKCKSVTSDKVIEITNNIGNAFRNINKSCGQYIRDNKDKIVKYYKGGCKGDFQQQN